MTAGGPHSVQDAGRGDGVAEPLVVDDFLLIDGAGGAPVPEARVVVEEGTIAEVGKAGLGRAG